VQLGLVDSETGGRVWFSDLRQSLGQALMS
jgi:hypothetical protein